MKKSDWTLLTLNLLAAFVALFGVLEPASDSALIVFFVVTFMLAANSAVIASRSRRRDDVQDQRGQDASNEMNPHQVLDLDARLEALERAQHDAVDAARWRALVESGQVTAPASDAPTSAASGTGPAVRNGR